VELNLKAFAHTWRDLAGLGIDLHWAEIVVGAEGVTPDFAHWELLAVAEEALGIRAEE